MKRFAAMKQGPPAAGVAAEFQDSPQSPFRVKMWPFREQTWATLRN